MRLPFSKIISIVSEVLAGVSATIVSGSDQSDGPSSVSEQRTCFEILARVLDTTVRSRPSSLIKANISDFLDSGTFAPPSADAMQAVEWNVLTAQVAAVRNCKTACLTSNMHYF
ncbi:hypothetical protein BC830DRAFT_253779 [Chytriomyces sp. MP71]|nr:hypothetical protein BC830DRAFT_253779 [Chytriomyces sp. MP71]